MESVDGGHNLSKRGRNQKSVIQRGNAMCPRHLSGHHDREYFHEDPWGHRDAEGEKSELVVVVAHTKAKKLAVTWVDVNVKVHILHVESSKPGFLGRE